ncbi:MAG: cytochrome [Frankiales bacterium]|nr:cytochrome [Frankiales bacterium]
MTTPGCPVRRLEPFSAEFTADPYPTLARVREEGPVVYDDSLDMFVVSRYDDIDSILMDPQTFSSGNVVRPVCPVGEEAREILANFHLDPVLANSDPPRHPRMRRVTAKRLTPRRMHMLESEIRARAEQLVDAMLALPVADFAAEVAFPLPAYTGLVLLGYPSEDFEQLKAWSRNRVQLNWGRADPALQAEIARNLVAHWEYTSRVVMDRYDNPQDDLISEVVQSHREDPEGLTLNEVITLIFTITTAAHESTTNAMLNALRVLLEHPDQYALLARDPSLVPNAVEETLRYVGSVISWRRQTTAATQVAGVDIPAGSQVLMLFGAANRDPAHFAEPQRFDVTRDNASQHFTFGRGTHYCLGAALARIQLQVVLDLLVRRAPSLQLAPQEIEFMPNLSHRGPLRLLVRTSAPA